MHCPRCKHDSMQVVNRVRLFCVNPDCNYQLKIPVLEETTDVFEVIKVLLDEAERADVFRIGAKAFYAGVKKEENPYPEANGLCRMAWDAGWVSEAGKNRDFRSVRLLEGKNEELKRLNIRLNEMNGGLLSKCSKLELDLKVEDKLNVELLEANSEANQKLDWLLKRNPFFREKWRNAIVDILEKLHEAIANVNKYRRDLEAGRGEKTQRGNEPPE